MAKRVSDEKLLEMMLIHGGASGAAAVLGISRTAVFKRLQDPVFRAQYDAAQGAVLSAAAASMTGALDAAIGCLLAVVEDSTASAGIRVQAADRLLSHCCRYVESANILRRLDELEVAAQRENG